MIPDIDTQLVAAIKSINDNVAPAVDPDNQLAQEQLYLAVATLNLVRQNLPFAHAYARQDLTNHVAQAEGLMDIEASSILAAAVDQARQVLADPTLGSQTLLAEARDLRDKIGVFLYKHQDDPKFDKLVIEHSKAGIDLGRAWTKGMGFEPDPAAVTDLSTLLKQ